MDEGRTDAVSETPTPGEPPEADEPKKKRSLTRTIIEGAISAAIVIGIFVFAIPKVADYSAVWKAFQSMTGLELIVLTGAMILNLFTYWMANMAALPALRLWPAAVLTQTTTSVANTLPGGGAIAVGLTYEILHSWGFTGTNVALYVGVTGIWNIFVKLALPVLSIAILVITGQSSSAFVTAAIVGVIALAIAVGLLAAVFASERLARSIGNGIGRMTAAILRLFHKEPKSDMGERAVKFRADTIGLVRLRWIRLTVTTIASQLALFLVLLLALRAMGISEADVSTAKVLAVFSFSRLLSAVPVTPGGVGVIDLGYIGGLAAGLPESEKAAVVAAVLIFRALTYGIQIPIGAFTYLVWRAKKDWRKDVPTSTEATSAAAV
jgi:putative heme transporter